VTRPPLGFGSTDERDEHGANGVVERKRGAGRGENVLSDGSNKRRKPD
jgi:hypothetical protein